MSSPDEINSIELEYIESDKFVGDIKKWVVDMNKRIIRNAAQCSKCHDVIESFDRHDFKFCKCEAIFVDGGHDYLRHGGSPEYFINLSEVELS